QGLAMDAPYDPRGNWKAKGPELAFLAARRRELRAGVEASEQRIAENRASVAAKLAPTLPLPDEFGINLDLVPMAHTQWLWGQVAGKLVRVGTWDELAAAGRDPGRDLDESDLRWSEVADLCMTLSPDVGTSTNINPAMDAKIYGPEHEENLETESDFKQRGRPELFMRADPWTRHIRFEIAEANCMSALGAFGKMAALTGVPFLPMMTVYDFFIKRALDQLYYNLYWGSSFLLLGTPSGVTLSPEGAQHSWKSDIQMPGLITWEPCFAREMEWILADAIRRHVEGDIVDRNGVLVRAVTRGINQKQFLGRLRAQPRFQGVAKPELEAAVRKDVLAGGYKLVDRSGEPGYRPGENVVVVLAMGSLVDQAIEASDALLEKGVHADVVVVTCADLLVGRFAQRDGYAQLRRLGIDGALHLEATGELDGAGAALLAARHVPIVSVADGEEGLLDNAGSILGVRQEALAVRKFSKSGTPTDIFRYQALDAAAIFDAVGKVLAETALGEVRLGRAAYERLAGSMIDGRPAPAWRELWPHQFGSDA
ncbi:MAG TPA: pyruvate dehydrogenase, partial [Planctomycetota bacterium]